MANAKRNSYAKKSYIIVNDKFVGVKFTFSDGGPDLVCMMEDLPPEVGEQAKCHGIHQKVGDSYNTADSAAEARRTATSTWTQLCEVGWNTGERGFSINLDDLARAICEIKGGSLIDTKAVLVDAEKEKIKELAANARLKALMQKYKLERLEKAAEEAGEFDFDLTTK
jgi:hypothetical protein